MKDYLLDWSIFCAGLEFDGNTIPSGQSLGGSETSAVQLAEELARQGHRPNIFCNTRKAMERGGVFFTPIGWIPQGNGGQFPKGFFDFVRSCPTDVLIVQRIPSMFQFETKSKVNFLWQHDLATRTGPSNFHPFLWNIDKIFVLSEFMRNQYKKVHGGIDPMYHITRNGIDLALVDSIPEQRRDRFKLMYTARPERGLDILLKAVFPRILQKEPRAKLYISRYQDPNPGMQQFYGELDQIAQQFGDRVQFLGNLGKQELYKQYKSARLFVYPSVFEEVYGITPVECAACGLPFLGPWRAALPETIGGAAPLIHDDGSLGQVGDETELGLKPPTDTFINGIVDQAVRLMLDDDYWLSWQKKAIQKSRPMSWEGVAKDWINLSYDIIQEKTSNPKRVLRHFLFNSDVVAAQKYADYVGDPQLKSSVERWIDRFVPFMGRSKNKPTLEQFYEERSGGDSATWQTAFWADREPRLAALKEFLRDKIASGEVKTLLDFGCAHGGYAKSLTDEFPNLLVVGVDASASLIRCANELKANGDCKHPENMEFFVASDDEQQLAKVAIDTVGANEFDCVVAMEVLEHLPDAEDCARKLEAMCKPGGYCVFTVPFGHRERDEFVTKNVPPVHVRSFDLHDLRDVWGKKPNYSIACFSDFEEHALDRTFSSWFMVTFKADQQPLGKIDWERKFFLQGPRETLGVAMIAHNSEDVMHRCLRSFARYADQIILIDNGPSIDRTVEVAGEYTDDVRAGTSPFWCYAHRAIHQPDQIDPNVCQMAGFETPRNESIEGMWADWVLWIDADEQLLDVGNLPKYLRRNYYLGYAMQQHHVAIDAGPNGIKKDIPVRLFRNINGMKAIGVVHEHFELGVNRGIGSVITVMSDVQIHHDGYLVESIRRGRFKRNFKLLECDRRKYPERILGQFLYEIRDMIHMARYELERNGGVLTPEVQRCCQIVMDTYRTKFTAGQYPLAEDALNYYSQALQILNLGIDVVADFDVKKFGASLGGGQSLRFRAMDGDEANTIIGHKIKAMASQVEGPYIQ